VTQFLIALVPTIGVLFIFWIGMRALLQADRRERAAQARIEAAERLANRSAGVGAPESGGGNAEAGPNNEDGPR
jgi:threonine/homoserine/homoserine lactone efflux protein